MHVDLHQRGADLRTNIQPGGGGVLAETNDVHYAMHKLGLCWVSQSTIDLNAEEVRGMELGHEIGIPCVVQCILWFSAPTRLYGTLGTQGMKVAKYHEAVNMAIAYATSRPFGGEDTQCRAC